MKLESVSINNFRCYAEEISVNFQDLTTFVGKNDIGKSSVLEALEIFFNNDTVVSGSADGTGTNARFAKLGGMVVSSNTIVAADTDNNNIRKLTMSGTVTTYAGAASES